jgi:hypothetical protein
VQATSETETGIHISFEACQGKTTTATSTNACTYILKHGHVSLTKVTTEPNTAKSTAQARMNIHTQNYVHIQSIKIETDRQFIPPAQVDDDCAVRM